jgi:hypothetical protein
MKSQKKHENKSKQNTSVAYSIQPIIGHLHPNID